MKKVYLIRHGLPDFPGGRRMCLGSTDLPLSESGFQQAADMARKLPPVTAVFASPLTRAIQTAQAIAMPISVLNDLRELDAGAWDGLTFDEIRLRFPDLYAARGRDRTLPLPGAESNLLGLERFQKAMEQAANIAPGDFAVVAHGGVAALFLEAVSGVWRKPNYTEIIPLIWKNGRFYLQEEL